MSTTDLGEEHLRQTPLIGAKVNDILSRFDKWLEGARFEIADPEKSEKLLKCNDGGLNKACQPLLIELGIYKKIPSQRLTYSVIRILPSYIAPLQNSAGSADLIPIRVIEGTPTVSGQALSPGSATHITKGVEVTSALDLLVIVTH